MPYRLQRHQPLASRTRAHCCPVCSCKGSEVSSLAMIADTETSPDDLDKIYGVVREPSLVREWEIDASPKSLVKLTKEVGEGLRAYSELAQHNLFRSVSQCSSFIWAMNDNGEIFISFEEIVVEAIAGDDVDRKVKDGFPRRRGFPSPPIRGKEAWTPHACRQRQRSDRGRALS